MKLVIAVAHHFSHYRPTESSGGYSHSQLLVQPAYHKHVSPQMFWAERGDPTACTMSTDTLHLGQEFCLLFFSSMTPPPFVFCGHCNVSEVSALNSIGPRKEREVASVNAGEKGQGAPQGPAHLLFLPVIQALLRKQLFFLHRLSVVHHDCISPISPITH